jgi:hypothetical protein
LVGKEIDKGILMMGFAMVMVMMWMMMVPILLHFFSSHFFLDNPVVHKMYLLFLTRAWHRATVCQKIAWTFLAWVLDFDSWLNVIQLPQLYLKFAVLFFV